MCSSMTEQTATLFGDLWRRYDASLFQDSVALFARRFAANGFDLDWFQGKRCLDAGCGGGRYSLAMAALGAAEVVGCDISSSGLEDARQRAAGINNVRFEQASVLDLPYPDAAFDFVCCSGVLHHTPAPERGLREITRVLRPGGKVYLLLYGTGGLRWPTIMQVRPHAQAMGYDLIDRAIKLARLPANKQRTFLDDLFVPLIRFYEWEEVQSALSQSGFVEIERWERGKLDHESSVAIQRKEFEQLQLVFESAKVLPEMQDRPVTKRGQSPFVRSTLRAVPANGDCPLFAEFREHASKAATCVKQAVRDLDAAQNETSAGRITRRERDWRVFGWGHHRTLAVKD